MTTTFTSTGARFWLARVSMVFLALLIVGIGFTAGGVGIIVGLVLGVLLLSSAAATFRNAYVIEGSRVGFRNGFTGTVRKWVDAGDIAVTTANYDNPGVVGSQPPTIVYWTRRGGSSGLGSAFARMTLSPDDKAAIERASTDGALRPFAVPISTLGPDAKRAFEQFSPPRRS